MNCYRYSDEKASIEHLEAIRWADKTQCPRCTGGHVSRKADGGRNWTLELP